MLSVIVIINIIIVL